MVLTPTIERAIQKASLLHRNQERRGAPNFPYITHLFSVAAILSNYTRDEEVIVAGLLHDTLEDTAYTKKDLEADFGKSVAEIVSEVSETKEENGQKVAWKVRKQRYIDTLKEARREALLVSAADKIHNLRSAIEDFKKHGPAIWKHFSSGPKDLLWFNREVLEVLKTRLNNGIVAEFETVYDEAALLFSDQQ